MAKKVKRPSKKSRPKVKKTVKRTTPKKVERSAPKNSAPIAPLGDRVVIRPLSEDEMGTRSPSGIIIPDTVSKEKPEQGIVIAVGPGKFESGKRVQVGVKEGDRVVFSKYGYDEVKIGGEEYFVVSESSILAVINS